MSSPSDFGDPNVPPLPHRRRHSTFWKRTPKWVKIVVGACLAAVIALIAIEQTYRAEHLRALAPKPPPAPGETFDKILSQNPQFDLVVTEAALNPKSRRIEGLVKNNSDRPYADVRISFYLPSRDLTTAHTAAVTIPMVGPRATANFSSEPLGEDFRQWTVERITGTPR
jgi:hypothetical protein